MKHIVFSFDLYNITSQPEMKILKERILEEIPNFLDNELLNLNLVQKKRTTFNFEIWFENKENYSYIFVGDIIAPKLARFLWTRLGVYFGVGAFEAVNQNRTSFLTKPAYNLLMLEQGKLLL